MAQRVLIILFVLFGCVGGASFLVAATPPPAAGRYTNMTDEQAAETQQQLHQAQVDACRGAGEQWDAGANACTGSYALPDTTGIEIPHPRSSADGVALPALGWLFCILSAICLITALKMGPSRRRR